MKGDDYLSVRDDLKRSSVDMLSVDDVDDFVDDIESKVNDILSLLQNCDVNDVDSVVNSIEEAKDLLSDLARDLY